MNKPRKRFATLADQIIMPVKVKNEAKTPTKSEVGPATAKNDKESARKLIEQLENKIPTVPSPVIEALCTRRPILPDQDLSRLRTPARNWPTQRARRRDRDGDHGITPRRAPAGARRRICCRQLKSDLG